jgi:hypothetical protein
MYSNLKDFINNSPESPNGRADDDRSNENFIRKESNLTNQTEARKSIWEVK